MRAFEPGQEHRCCGARSRLIKATKGNGMRQSRLMSVIESLANVVVGYGVAVMTQIAIFPLFGLRATLAQSMAIGSVFTVVSIGRSYMLRRIFERLRERGGRIREQSNR